MNLIFTLASRNLLHDRVRLIATIVGIVFSIVLVTVQLGVFLSFERMITTIIRRRPTPRPQRGKVVVFKRRTPDDSNLAKVRSLEQAFDWIRMLDAEGYPKAFLRVGKLRLEFERASLKAGRLLTDVTITETKKN